MPAPSPWANLGSYLHAARHRTACSQRHIAREIGISQAAYSQIERGQIRPRPALICHLAVVLDADVARLALLASYSLEQVLATAPAE
jgi:transcriptional regulator with XRE-family HTH domain